MDETPAQRALRRKLKKAWDAYHDACAHGHVLRAAYDRGEIDHQPIFDHIRNLDRLYMIADRLHNERYRAASRPAAAMGGNDE